MNIVSNMGLIDLLLMLLVAGFVAPLARPFLATREAAFCFQSYWVLSAPC